MCFYFFFMDDIQGWINKLINCGKLIVVEGIKDKAALEEFGIKHIVVLKKPLFQVTEEINDKEVVLLTDLDKEGKKLYGKLKKDLNKRGIKVDTVFREWLFKNTKLRQIEGLPTYFRNSH